MSAFFKAKNNKSIDSVSDEESSSSSSLSVSQISIEDDNNLENI